MNLKHISLFLNIIIAGWIFMTAGSASAGLKDAAKDNYNWAAKAFSKEHLELERDKFIIAHEDVAGCTRIGRSAAGGPIRLGHKTYSRGIGVNSHSVLRVSLIKPAERFLADIGLDRNVDGKPASVRFHISVDDKDLFSTDIMRPNGEVKSIDLPLKGAKTFDLIVDNGGDDRGFDQGDWGDARVILQDGSVVWLDDLANQIVTGTEFPFSFVYGGKPSSEFLHTWKYETKNEEIDSAKHRRTITFTDPDTGLEIKAVVQVYLDTPGTDWTIYFTNKGDKDTPVIEQVRAVDLKVKPSENSKITLHRLNGTTYKLEDFIPFDDDLQREKKIEFSPNDGRSSDLEFPFFNLDWGSGGVITAVGWTGQWCASAEQLTSGELRLQAGMQYTHLKLHPGESIRTPRILQVFWTGRDHLQSYNLFRQTMIKHIMPKIDGKVVEPPIAHLTTVFYEGLAGKSSESAVISYLKPLKELGFESSWLDAYWMHNWGMGYYGFPIKRVEDPAGFPNGLRPVGDASHKEGLKFIVWYAPEDVQHDSYIAKEHPEWVIFPSFQKGVNEGNYGMFDLGIPEAREYMTSYLKTVIREYDMDCLRVDRGWFGGPLPCWQLKDKDNPDRIGISEIRGVEGLYKMWDDILTEFPHLYIDNCAGGGRRIDLETCARSIPLWITDATTYGFMPGQRNKENFDKVSIQNQTMIAGLSRYLPCGTTGAMGSTPYWFRSAYNGGISFCEDIREKDYPKEKLKKAIIEGKRLRKYFYADFYPLVNVSKDPIQWHVVQYHISSKDSGAILAFRRDKSPYGSFICNLYDIDPKAKYHVTHYYSYELKDTRIINGSELQHLKIEINEMPGSVLIEYKKVK